LRFLSDIQNKKSLMIMTHIAEKDRKKSYQILTLHCWSEVLEIQEISEEISFDLRSGSSWFLRKPEFLRWPTSRGQIQKDLPHRWNKNNWNLKEFHLNMFQFIKKMFAEILIEYYFKLIIETALLWMSVI
jgi:hypothetical protein